MTLYAFGFIGIIMGYLIMKDVLIPKFDKWLDEN